MSIAPRILYLSYAPDEVYALIAEQVPSSFRLVTLDADSDDERCARIADCEVVIIAGTGLRGPLIQAAKQLRLAHSGCRLRGHRGLGATQGARHSAGSDT